MVVPEPQRSTWLAIVIVCAGFSLCYTSTAVFGSQSVSPTLYVPFVLMAAARFRYAGALLAATVATLLAGPMRPALATVSDQEPAVWIGRGLVFVLVGVVTAALIDRIAADRARELELAEQERDFAIRQAAVIATVSHEFRTPLTIIGGMARTLETQRMVTAEGLPLLAGITDATRRLTDLVNTVGAVLDDSGGEAFLRREPIILCELMSSVMLNVAIRDVRSRVAIDIASGAEVFVSDRELLGQLLRHIVDNAARFSPPEEQVLVRARRAVGRLEVHVLDRGPGIDPGILRSFEPFLQGDQSSTRARGGLGLGLFAASRLAAVLGGSLSFHERPGGGTGAVITVDAPDYSAPELIAIRDDRPQIFANGRRSSPPPPS